MTFLSFWLCSTCGIFVGLVSLASSHLFRKDNSVSSELVSLISFVPAFCMGLGYLLVTPIPFTFGFISILAIKNMLYCFAFYLRYESLRKFGPFAGALMLGTQPVIIFALGVSILNEQLSVTQVLSILLITAALLSLATKGNSRGIHRRIFFGYYIVPTLISSLVVICDRYFLRDKISEADYFALDRFLLLPAFLIVLAFVVCFKLNSDQKMNRWLVTLKKNWFWLISISILFTAGAFFYNFALGMEKAAVVSLFRNASYPVAAFIGVFLFKHHMEKKDWVSLALVSSAILLGTL